MTSRLILPKALVLLQDECFGKNYLSFLDFTRNCKWMSGIFDPCNSVYNGLQIFTKLKGMICVWFSCAFYWPFQLQWILTGLRPFMCWIFPYLKFVHTISLTQYDLFPPNVTGVISAWPNCVNMFRVGDIHFLLIQFFFFCKIEPFRLGS